MYKSLTRFLDENSIDSLIGYDLKNESPWEGVRNERISIKKMEGYKRNNKETNLNFDCDNSNGTCTLSDSIYQELWNWSYRGRFTLPFNLQEKFSPNWDRLGSDTMNSFATIYRQALRLNNNNKSVVDQNKHLQKFAILTHTVGNLTLVPFNLNHESDTKSFNQSRGFRGSMSNQYFVYDFFDLSLKLIKENLDQQTFQTYIDTFYLQDFVNVDDNYSIKPLFGKHQQFLVPSKMDISNPQDFLPTSNEEIQEFLVNVNNLISKRSKRMINALKSKRNISIDTVEEQPQSRTTRVKTTKDNPTKLSKRVPLWVKLLIPSYIVSNIGVLVYADKTGIGVKSAIDQYGLLTTAKDFIQGYSSFTLTVTGIVFVLSFILAKTFSIGFDITLDKMGKCDSCRKLFAMKKVQTDVINSRGINIKTELNQKDLNGEVVGTIEQFVQGTREFYETTYECKHCGNTHSYKRSREFINS